MSVAAGMSWLNAWSARSPCEAASGSVPPPAIVGLPARRLRRPLLLQSRGTLDLDRLPLHQCRRLHPHAAADAGDERALIHHAAVDHGLDRLRGLAQFDLVVAAARRNWSCASRPIGQALLADQGGRQGQVAQVPQFAVDRIFRHSAAKCFVKLWANCRLSVSDSPVWIRWPWAVRCSFSLSTFTPWPQKANACRSFDAAIAS